MSDTTEHEAISNFVDATKEAASATLKLEFPELHPFAPRQFVTAIRRASASANQLGQMQKNPGYWAIRDSLEHLTSFMKMVAVNNMLGIAPEAHQGQNPFEMVSHMLLKIGEKGKQIATSKPLDRQTTLAVCDALSDAQTAQ